MNPNAPAFLPAALRANAAEYVPRASQYAPSVRQPNIWKGPKSLYNSRNVYGTNKATKSVQNIWTRQTMTNKLKAFLGTKSRKTRKNRKSRRANRKTRRT
jgi:hypothetical protein